MVQYSDELKEEIRAANDIVDVISQYVTLKRSGRNFFGLCPFHKEKSPSFSVSADRQYFHCFGCHKGGDVFTFISEIEYVDVSALDVETASRRKSLYGFSSYPAFVIYDTTNDEFIPVASLEFNKNAPLTATELEAWLKENTSLNFK